MWPCSARTEMYDEYGNLVIPQNYGRIHFGRQEIVQILISVVVLTIALTIALLGGFLGDLRAVTANVWLYALVISAIVSVTGFLLHELAHKFIAQRFGAWAEFRMYPMGLFMALLFSFMGFLFAAPGAVYIQGRITRKQNGMISLAGPSTNIAFGAIFIALWLLIPDMGIWSSALILIGTLTMFLAVFNLLPFGPLDGRKVWNWNHTYWALAMVIAVGLLMVRWVI